MSKRVVITGGTSGMGRATMEAFLKQGASVVITAENNNFVEDIMKEHDACVKEKRLFFFRCDSSKPEDVQNLADFVSDTLGGIDALANCAGVYRGGDILSSTLEEFDFQFNVNVKGAYLICKAFLPFMIGQKSGTIVNVSSISGERGDYNATIYCATKAAVNNLTRCMALDYGKYGIRVNAICPYATKTRMFLTGTTDEVMQKFVDASPLKRASEPEEMADVIVYLSSDQSSYINGQCIGVDSGLSAWCGQPPQDKSQNS